MKIDIWYAMGTFRTMDEQGKDWGPVLPNIQSLLSYNKYPDPREDTTALTDSFRKQRAQGPPPNHNGWLGSHHLLQRKVEYQLSWDDIYMIVLGNPPSWTTECQFLGKDVQAWIHSTEYVGYVNEPRISPLTLPPTHPPHTHPPCTAEMTIC